MLRNAVIVLISLLLLAGCAERRNLSPRPTIPAAAHTALDSPIDCSRARADIKILEEERASVGKQLLAGVRSVMPIAAAAGILMGDYRDRVQVATGRYNEDLEKKISAIRWRCGEW
jgi:hypothetical protein